MLPPGPPGHFGVETICRAESLLQVKLNSRGQTGDDDIYITEEQSQRQWGLAAGIGLLPCGLTGVPEGTPVMRRTDQVRYVCGLLPDQQDPEAAASGQIGGGVVTESHG